MRSPARPRNGLSRFAPHVPKPHTFPPSPAQFPGFCPKRPRYRTPPTMTILTSGGLALAGALGRRAVRLQLALGEVGSPYRHAGRGNERCANWPLKLSLLACLWSGEQSTVSG